MVDEEPVEEGFDCATRVLAISFMITIESAELAMSRCFIGASSLTLSSIRREVVQREISPDSHSSRRFTAWCSLYHAGSTCRLGGFGYTRLVVS